MKKTELQELVQECIAEILDERSTNKGYDEFQRADKGSKGVAAKDKSEEDVYGAGYAAGERAAKTKYKKLAEAYKQLKEDGFGLNKDPYEESKEIKEIEKTAAPVSTDAKAVVSIIEKMPMLMQKLSLLNSRNELEDVFNYLFTKVNPQLSKNTTGIRTAATNAAQNLNQKPEEINEEVDLVNQISSIDWKTAIPVLSAVGLLTAGAISTLKQALKNPKELADRVRKEM